MEKRRIERYDLNIPIRLEVHQWEGEGAFKGQTVEGILCDISERGLGIVSKFPLAIDMFVQITVPAEKRILPLIGKIVRVEILEPNEKFKYGCILAGTSLSRQLALQDYIRENFKESSE